VTLTWHWNASSSWALLDKLSKLPKSLLCAAGNKFSRSQLEQFQSISKNASIDPQPLFLVGKCIFPENIFWRTSQPGWSSLGIVSKYMTVGTLRGYKRYAAQDENDSALASSTDNRMDKIHGIIVFGLNECLAHSVISTKSNYETYTFKVAMVQIILADGRRLQLEARIHARMGSQEFFMSPGGKSWSISNELCSSSFRALSKVTKGAKEMELEYGTANEREILGCHVREMGFHCSLSDLRTSILIAISRTLKESQVVSNFFFGKSILSGDNWPNGKAEARLSFDQVLRRTENLDVLGELERIFSDIRAQIDQDKQEQHEPAFRE
jgi:hypothetical protein